MATLYDLTQDWMRLDELMTENPDLDLSDTIAAMECDLEEKLDGCARFIRNNESDIDAIKAEIKRLKVKAQVLTDRNERFKRYMVDCMNSLGIKKTKVGTFNISVRHNSVGSLILDVPEEQIPAEFVTQRITYSVDKKKLKEALLNGELHGMAHIQIAPDSISIK